MTSLISANDSRTRTGDGERTEVWFLTGSQSMYGEGTLHQVEVQSRTVADRLVAADSPSADVVWKPVLVDSATIRHVCLDANRDDRCIGVIAWMHTFSPAKMWIQGLDELRKPLLHLHTQANESLPWSAIDMDFMNLNQAAHGDREFAHVQTRLGIARKTIAGHVGDATVQQRILTWMRACAGAAALRRLRMARFGDNMRNVAVTDGDKVEAEHRFGVSVNSYAVNDLVAVVDQIGDSAVDELIDTYLDLYDVAAELRPGAERAEELRDAARIEAGLRTFLDDGGFRAFTTNFEDLGGLRQLPGLAVQRLMADGYGFGAEGDWKTGSMVHTLKAMSVGLPGGTSFMEDYTYHLGPGTPKVLGAHMLEVCPTITTSPVRVEIHRLDIGGRNDPVRMRFLADSGPAVIVGLADLGDRFRFVLNEVDLVAPDEPMPQLPVAHAMWTPRPSMTTALECWLTSGGPHHTVLSSSVDTEAFYDLATMLRTELVVIDSHTTTRRFADELRWNQAYYRLAQGF
jgi:L-arabinose isomerase